MKRGFENNGRLQGNRKRRIRKKSLKKHGEGGVDVRKYIHVTSLSKYFNIDFLLSAKSHRDDMILFFVFTNLYRPNVFEQALIRN